MSEYKLSQRIIALSQASSWTLAKQEWSLHSIYQAEEPDTCLCGHFPIIEICVLKNKLNDNETVVGNHCVRNFIGLPSDKIFQAIKRISIDDSKSLNAEAIVHFHYKGWINDWEYNYYSDILRRRALSIKQLSKKRQINGKVLSGIASVRRRG